MSKNSSSKKDRLAILDTSEYIRGRCILGYQDCFFYVLIGGRGRGKTYFAEDFCTKRALYNNERFYWLRISPKSTARLLANNADSMIDPDIVRRFDLSLSSRTNKVYNGDKLFAEVFALADMAKWKGVALYDSDYDGYYNIVLDEFNLETGKGGEKRTQDVVYNFINMIETLIRDRKTKIRVFMLANQLEECSDILMAFNFIPEDYGIFHLKKKRAVIYNIPNSAAYKEKRKGSVSDLLGGDRYKTFSNALDVDLSRINKGRLKSPTSIFLFPDNIRYTLWDDTTIADYHNEKCNQIIAMKPYLDAEFIPELRDSVFQNFDARRYMFRSVVLQKKFKYDLELIKPRK